MMPVNGDIAAGDAVIRFHQRKQRSRRALLPAQRVMQVILGVVRPDDRIIHVRAGNPDPRDEIVVLCQTRRKVCSCPDVDFRRRFIRFGQFKRFLRCAWETKQYAQGTFILCRRFRCLRRFLAFEAERCRSSYSPRSDHFRVLPDERAEQHRRAAIALAAARKIEGESACFCFMMFLPSHRQYSFLPCMA